ncbi:Gp37 family protein, partial [Avibacterium paragallinarum]
LVHQRRDVHLALTIIARSQHDDSGALEVLDKVRLAIVGFRPTNCEPCVLISEEFAGEDEGLWQYQLIVQTSTWQVEQRDLQNSHKFTTALLRRADQH